MGQANNIEHSDRSVPMRRVLGATSLTKDPVRNRNGDDLGSLKEVMIDIPAGRVAYAVLSFGGFLGIGNKLFAIPWEMITVDEDRQCLLLDVDKKTLEEAPGFDKDHWPDMSNREFGTQIYTYYGRTPYWN
jgi:sporulation protein YlmC with PRC-barrel domain